MLGVQTTVIFALDGVMLNLLITGCVSSSHDPRLISLGSMFYNHPLLVSQILPFAQFVYFTYV